MSEICGIPIVLDTDIGGDIDDTWALAMLLNCPELDVKLVVSSTGDTEYRAKILAKFLEVASRTDIPVGIGEEDPATATRLSQLDWVKDYDLASYPGEIKADGVQAIIDAVNSSRRPVTIIGVGPLTNIGAALERNANFVANANFVGMLGSIAKNLKGADGAIAEFNVQRDVAACRKAFQAPWLSMTITPLDTCARVVLDGELYRRLRTSSSPMIRALLENYRIWAARNPAYDPETASSILFDTVAVHLAYSTKFLRMTELGIRIDENAFTVVDPQARKVNCAIDWTDLADYQRYLVERLLSLSYSS